MGFKKICFYIFIFSCIALIVKCSDVICHMIVDFR